MEILNTLKVLRTIVVNILDKFFKSPSLPLSLNSMRELSRRPGTNQELYFFDGGFHTKLC